MNIVRNIKFNQSIILYGWKNKKQVSILFLAFILIEMTACCGSDNKITSTQDTMDVYFREFTDGANKLTPEQLQDFIKTVDIVLECL